MKRVKLRKLMAKKQAIKDLHKAGLQSLKTLITFVTLENELDMQ